jgi:hypothetical protein
MHLTWGVILIVFTLILGWLSQVVNALFPKSAERVGLNEKEAEVDPAFWADSRGEAAWDALSLWTLPVAGLLLVAHHPAWVYFGLIGGGMYLYFSGRAIAVRMSMQRRGIRIGPPGYVKLVYALMVLNGTISVVTIGMAVAALS